MKLKAKLKSIDPFLVGSGLMAAFLNIYGIWREPYANPYYTAAVTSMLQSFHNFFFASFDPGGFVTVDKPPLAFWVQAMFASLLGIHGWSVILPQALAGIGSVILIYFLVKPSFGQRAARLSALVMACTPIAVAVSRTNNVDSLLVFILLMGTWLLFKGVKNKRVISILAAFAMVGLGFNTKMLEAYMVLPAFYIFFWLGYKEELRRKIGALLLATFILLGTSFSWAVAVDNISQDKRPYIGSSETNSVLELSFGYNGISRLIGQHRTVVKDQEKRPDEETSMLYSEKQVRGSEAETTQSPPVGSESQSSFFSKYGVQNSNTLAAWLRKEEGVRQGPRGSLFNIGAPGPLRLFQTELAGQISWLIPLACLGGMGVLVGWKKQESVSSKQKECLFWLTWLFPMAIFFSTADFFHQYYLVMLAPAIAVLCGAGLTEMLIDYDEKKDWKRWLLPAALGLTTLFQVAILLPYQGQIGLRWPIAVGIAGIGITIYLYWGKEKFSHWVAIGGIVVLLSAPLYWAATPFLYGDSSVFPLASPLLKVSGNDIPSERQEAGQLSRQESGVDNAMLMYLENNNTGEKFLFATTNINTAEAYVIKTGKAVMAMGGFSGSDPILTVDRLKEMIARDEVKYFLFSPSDDERGNTDLLKWIEHNGKVISPAQWQGSNSANSFTSSETDLGSEVLYEIGQN